jgi:hypothetical protein
MQAAFSNTLSEQAKISLLTCQPGTNAYSVFGHTALHIQDEEKDINVVFNYGIFSFYDESFLYKFVKGETYYVLGSQDYERFFADYMYDKRGIYSQELNLTQEEKNNVFKALLINYLPENKTYLYNYFFDNCSTRVRDIIEKNINGILIYPQSGEIKTFRDLIAEYTGKNTWLKFGIDILVGAPADNVISDYEKMFLPDYLEYNYEKALVDRDGELKPLVKKSEFVIPYFPVKSSNVLFSPIVIMLLFLLLTIIISIYDKKRGKVSYYFDFVLFFVLGLIGCLIVFVSFFSIHPAVFPNYNILWISPLHLIFAICLFVKPLRAQLKYYMYFNLFMLASALILSFFAQSFNFAFYPLMIAVAVRSSLIASSDI